MHPTGTVSVIWAETSAEVDRLCEHFSALSAHCGPPANRQDGEAIPAGSLVAVLMEQVFIK